MFTRFKDTFVCVCSQNIPLPKVKIFKFLAGTTKLKDKTYKNSWKVAHTVLHCYFISLVSSILNFNIRVMLFINADGVLRYRVTLNEGLADIATSGSPVTTRIFSRQLRWVIQPFSMLCS